MTSETLTEQERQQTLRELGLNPDAPGLADSPAKPTEQQKSSDERRAISAADIVFEPEMLDRFPNLDGAHMAEASRYLFDLYKSPHRDKERHALLHRRIGEFISQVRRARKTAGVGGVTEKIKATKEQRDIAALMAEKGLTAADLAQIIKERA